ncbi:hypothetical protein [Paenibacillus hunanensis]|uniref:Uncharacterized protein n=1 Tax=Paenibacillus hunanensis TaxID=539262 RepID=A0ABU1J1R0_9BACL|nr:hypothetical protein [Paenibacillus hunanensis]MDR6245444.1 hypothetical protein [Paenibacillus hunanensis]GGJ27677.1 hypothetical protein GCM10008022_40760 [Paenibacillus hunanensis]
MDWILDVTTYAKIYRDRKALIEGVIDTLLSELIAQSSVFIDYNFKQIEVSPMTWQIEVEVDTVGKILFDISYSDIRDEQTDKFPGYIRLPNVLIEVITNSIKESLRPF